MGFPDSSAPKESTHNAGDLGSIPGLGRSPGKEMAIHFSILTWRIPRTEELGRLQSTGSQRVRLNLVTSLSLESRVSLMAQLVKSLV